MPHIQKSVIKIGKLYRDAINNLIKASFINSLLNSQ